MADRRDEIVLGVVGALCAQTQFLGRPQCLVQMLARLPEFGMITHDTRKSRNGAGRVVNRRQCAARPEAAGVLSHVGALVARLVALERHAQLPLGQSQHAILGGVEHRCGTADCFALAPTEQALRPAVPGGDAALVIDHENRGVGRVLQQQPEALLAFAQGRFHAFALADVPEHRDRGDHFARAGADRRRADRQRASRAVRAQKIELLVADRRARGERARQGPILRLIHLAVRMQALEGDRRRAPWRADHRQREGQAEQFRGAVVAVSDRAARGLHYQDGGRHLVDGCLQARLGGVDGLLRALARRDVHEGDDDAVDAIVGGAIRDRSPQVPCAAMSACFGFRGDQGREHQARFLGEIAVAEFGLEVIDRSPDVGRTQRDQLVHRRCEAPYLQLQIQKDDPDTGAAPQVGQVIIGGLELSDLRLQLSIDGDQLLVHRLELFLAGLQLLVGALQLLVDRDDFLVGSLQLLVAGLERLDGALQLAARDAQLLLQQRIVRGILRHALRWHGAHGRARLSGRCARALGLEAHPEVSRATRRHQRCDRNANPRRIGAVLHVERLDHDTSAAGARLTDSVPYRGADAEVQHLEQIARRFAERLNQKGRGVTMEIDDAILRIHDDRGRPELLEQRLLHGKGRCRTRAVRCEPRRRGDDARGYCGKLRMAMAVRADAAVDAMLEADRLEHALQRARGFRTAEEQRATMLEREMQQRQHALLDVGLEINEQIAAGADIDV